ncbi:hypothetical protein RF11_09848 [Thelohanellus kitauei]|uniref:Uncharacterized protein n=1 Tax=Thelohanellus kitauei TaxID=669202 RepID=A0A0C2JPE2_THEKT|nr:hypothetical protein RF11_09848 [Thelohanellus kitauei]
MINKYFRLIFYKVKVGRLDVCGTYNSPSIVGVEYSYLLALRIEKAMTPQITDEELPFSIGEELKSFFESEAKLKLEVLNINETGLQKIAYLVDIFATLNELKLPLQVPSATFLESSENFRYVKDKTSALANLFDQI